NRARASRASHGRVRSIGFSKAIDVRYAEWMMPLVSPAERSGEGPAQREESSTREVRLTPAAEQDRTRVLDAATGPPAIESYRPDVVERHVAEKRVAA